MKENIDSIYLNYFNDIYRFIFSLCRNHHTTEDLVQETFLRAHLYIENYQEENVKSWLFTVAHHAFIDYHRKHKKSVLKEQNFFLSLLDKRKSVADQVILHDEIDQMITALDTLPEKHQFAVLLCDFHDLTYAEAAELMEVKQSHFKVLLFRGRQALRQRKAENNE